MDEYINREAVFQVVHGIARGIATKDIEALKAKDMKTLYKIKGAKEILDSVDTDLCYIPVADVKLVKHGKWEQLVSRQIGPHYEVGARCSCCNEYTLTVCMCKAMPFEFCPHCSADMRGDTELREGV